MAENILLSKYDIYEKLLQIAGKHVFEEDGTDFLRVGLFGYLTEGLASAMRDNVYHKLMLYNESFLNTAIIPESVYNYAKMFNVNVGKAQPARASVDILIPVGDIKKETYTKDEYGTAYDNATVIDRNGYVAINEFYFKLEKLIVIQDISDKKGNLERYSAKYILSEPELTNFVKDDIFTDDDYYDKYNNIRTTVENDNLILHDVKMYQFKTTKISKQITTSSILDTKVHIFEFPEKEQFSGISMRYTKYPNYKDKKIELYYLTIDTGIPDNVVAATKVLYGFYSLNDLNEVKVNFLTSLSGFLPETNSILSTEIYLTYGTKITAQIIGDHIYNNGNNKAKDISILVSFNSGIEGGLNVPSIDKIKQRIINELSTRNIILTETDLNQYFEILTTQWENYNGKIKFIKKRDDILKRIFLSFVLLRSGTDTSGNINASPNYILTCIPTNTVDVDFALIENKLVPLGAKVIAKTNTYDEYMWATSVLTQSQSVGNQLLMPKVQSVISNDYYFIPFYMFIMLTPFKRVKYIYNLTNSSLNVVMRYDDYTDNSNLNSANNIYAENINLYRGIGLDGTADNSYTLSLTLVSDSDLNLLNTKLSNEQEITISVYNKFPLDSLIPLTALIRIIGNDNVLLGPLIKKLDNLYTREIKVTLHIDKDNEFNFFNSNSVNPDYGETINIKSDSGTNNSEILVGVPSEAYLKVKFNNVMLSNNEITSSFILSNKLTFFEPLDNIMQSDIVLNKKTFYNYNGQYYNNKEDAISAGGKDENITSKELVTSIKLEQVPVIHSLYLSNVTSALYSQSIKQYVTQIQKYIKMLKDGLSKLEANTFFDMKFFNTYGRSKYYDIALTNINATINIELYTRFKLREDVKNNIKDYIRILFDSYNSGEFISILLIITSTMLYFNAKDSIIKDMSIPLLNSLDQQSIRPIEGAADHKYLYIPEYINLDQQFVNNNVHFK